MNITENQQSTEVTNGSSSKAAESFGAAMKQLAGEKGITLTDDVATAGGEAPEVPDPSLAVGTTPPEKKPDPAVPQVEDPKALIARLVDKDAKFQGERKLRRTVEAERDDYRKRYDELVEAIRTDPVGAGRKHGARFGDIAAAELAAEKAGKQKPAPSDEVPAWAKELQTEVKSLREHRDELLKEREQFRAERRQEARKAGIADMLKDNTEFSVLNELGKHDVVLKLVEQHLGDDGDVPDERELQEIIVKYAREVERQLRADVTGLVKKKSIAELVAQELGHTPAAPKKAAKPARQEIEGEVDERDGAPVLSNGLAQQRVSTAPPAAWDKEKALRATAAQMQSLFKQSKAQRDDD